MTRIVGYFSLFLIFSSAAFADSITLHLLRSPLGINWKSPFTMTISALKNSLAYTQGRRAFGISHVFVEVSCDSTGERIFRGQTSTDDSNERELIFKEKYGMGVMFHTYKGKYEKDSDILKDLSSYEGSPRRGAFKALISPATCQRMLRYADEYERLGFGQIYSGLQADPLKGEGAGCSAFGISFLRIGGILEPFMKNWQNVIDVPKRFIGGPLTGKEVHILKILKRPQAKWSSKEPHIHLEAWNPEKMHDWVEKTYDEFIKDEYQGSYLLEVEKLGKSKTVIVDLTDRKTPTGSFWMY